MTFADEPLTDKVRNAIHHFALRGREILTDEARDELEGVYGVHETGEIEPLDDLPALTSPEAQETYRLLKETIVDEVQAGLSPGEAVAKLVNEIAFTHLNRLAAFKMFETSKLIREAVGRGSESNGFKFYLADHPQEEATWKAGELESAYRHYLIWQAGEIAKEIPVLFDPENLASRLFPRLPALNAFLALLNAPELTPAWQAEETIGWIYQFFNERENEFVFDRLFKQKQKIRRQDIPAATQRYTPRWIVRFLVENSLGRLWVQMHPDSRLADQLRYLVPVGNGIPNEKLRPVKDISLLDPACGTMHFGLVAFDIFVEMYREEIENFGRPGWPETPSVKDQSEIPAAIIEHNLFGIDIDLRAVQLSALTLYLKAKRINKKAILSDHNLACADVMPFSPADLGRFIIEMRFSNPIFERMLRRIREQLINMNQIGSLLRIEKDLHDLVEEEQRKHQRQRQAKYGNMNLEQSFISEEERDASKSEYYVYLEAQLIQALDFFRKSAADRGEDMRFFTGEAVKSLYILDLMLRRYDCVVANPPFMSRRNMNNVLADFLSDHYDEAKGDLYAAFIARCAEFANETGRVGMITQQSFMFISSYEKLRTGLLDEFAIETMAHTGPHAFPEIQGEKVNTTAFVLRREPGAERRANSVGTYFRLVHEPDADSKRTAFEKALAEL